MVADVAFEFAIDPVWPFTIPYIDVDVAFFNYKLIMLN